MIPKRTKAAFALAVPLAMAAGAALPMQGAYAAASRSAQYDIQDSYDMMQEQANYGSRQTLGRIPSPKSGASTEEVRKYVQDSLNSNAGLNEDIKIKGRTTNDDGTYSVAITYYTQNYQKNIVVTVGKDGVAEGYDDGLSDEQLQRQYDEIVYGGKNEMSMFDVISVNEALHSSTKEFFGEAARLMGIDEDTAAGAAAGAVSLAGVVILGAGQTERSKKALLSDAVSTAKARSRKTAGEKISAGLTGQTGNADYDAWIKKYSAEEGVPANLLYCLLNQESGFNPDSVSKAGAVGIAQFIPETAASMGIDPTDPQQAIKGAARLLRMEYDNFGSWELALAAYNAGGRAVSKYNGIPPYPETQNYVESIMSAYNSMPKPAEKGKPVDIRSGVEGKFNSQISDAEYYGMTETTRKFIDTLTGNFYAQTGIIVNLTSGYRAGDAKSWHSAGIAFDVTADEFEGSDGKEYRTLYGKMASQLGGTPLDEYPGEPGEIYARGSNFHVSVHNQ